MLQAYFLYERFVIESWQNNEGFIEQYVNIEWETDSYSLNRCLSNELTICLRGASA